MTTYTCTIETCEFETSSPLGMTSHARKHRNRFEELVGRPPEDYEEVRAFFNGEADHIDVPQSEQQRLTEVGE